MPPIKLGLNPAYSLGGWGVGGGGGGVGGGGVVGEMLFEEFQDGHHGCYFGYQNGMISAILNLHVFLLCCG